MRMIPARVLVGAHCLLLVPAVVLAQDDAAPFDASSAAEEARVDEMLRDRLVAAGGDDDPDGGIRLAVGQERLHAAAALPAFYERRDYQPAWLGDMARARQLVAAVRAADREGLRPADYHLERLDALMAAVERAWQESGSADPQMLVDLDLLLTDAFLVYGSHLVGGRQDPVELDPDWEVGERTVRVESVLELALESGDVAGALEGLKPTHPDYSALREILASYRRAQLAGGWPTVGGGPPLRLGDRGPRVGQLRKRLAATWDLSPRLADGENFDADVDAAVRAFQARHGLDTDGVVSVMMLAELNAPVEQRIEQVALNMERWRWLPGELGERHIRVNIAGFELSVHEDTGAVMRMRAMVGHQYRETPVFSDTVRLVVFSPFWNVPRTIAVEDMVPRVAADPDYLRENSIEVWSGWGAGARRVDPGTIDWAVVDTARFAYRFRQHPVPSNPMGRVKFMFPNRFDVYVHDTPAREMFDQAERAFSSGCIRIERPAELATYLLGPAGWTLERVQAAMEASGERSVSVPEPLPIHILYWTAWMDDDGRVHFRNDIYRRDVRLREAMRAPPPTALRGPAVHSGG